MSYVNIEYLLGALSIISSKENDNQSFLDGIETAKEIIKNAPAADVAPVVHGKWIDKGSLSCRCSNCGCKSTKETPYCAICGAKMDKED